MNFNVLMENYSRVKELTEESANSAGTADEKYEAYMDSMAAATKRLENAWESFTMKLESSKVLRWTSEALAGIVENMDKLLPLITTALTVLKSSSILKFFTGGEGGFLSGGLGKFFGTALGTRTTAIGASGEVTQTQTFRNRVTSSLEDIKKSLYKMAFGEPSVSGDGTSYTWGIGSRTQHAWKWHKYKKMQKRSGLPDDYYSYYNNDGNDIMQEHAAYIADVKQRAAGTGMAAGFAVMSRLSQNKQVGSSGITGLINKTGQTVEEDSKDKTLGVVLSGLGAGAGSFFFGPLGGVLGQVIGDNVADLISFGLHRSELEHKREIAQAKENIEKLTTIDSSIDSVKNEALKDDSDINLSKLEESVYNLYKDISQYDYGSMKLLEDIKDLTGKNVNSYSDLFNILKESDQKTREDILYGLEYVAAQQERKNKEDERSLLLSQEDNLKNKKIIAYNRQYLGQAITLTIDEVVGDITGKELSEQYNILREYIAKNEFPKLFLEEDKEKIRNRMSEIKSWLDSVDDLNRDMNSYYLKEAFAAPIRKDLNGRNKYIGQYTSYELQAMGPEELYRLIAQNLTSAGVKGVRGDDKLITKEWEDQIKAYIQENYSAALSYDQRSLSQLQKSRDELKAILKELGVTDSSLREQYETDSITIDLKGYDESLIGGLLSATDPQKVKDFATAWGYTVEQFEELAKNGSDVYKILLNLSEAQAMMSPTEVTEYYKGFSSILSDITESLWLSKDSLQNIINNYPQLLKYFKQEGDFLTATSELYKTLMDEQNFVYKNAVKNAYMSSTSMFGDFKNKNLTPEQRAVIDKNSVSTFDSLVAAINEGKISASIIDAARQYLDMDLAYKVDNPLLNSAMEYENKIIDKQISALGEQKKALEDVNSVREKELQLIKAKQKLEDAKTNKQIVYREGVGFVYEANQDAVQEAQKEIEDLESQRTAENVQREIDQLNLAKDILSNMTEESGMLSLKNSFDALQKAISGNGGEESGGLSAQIALLNKAYQDGTATVNLSDSFLQDIEGDEASKGFLPEIEGSVSYIEEVMGKNNSLLEKIAEVVVAENVAKDIERKKNDYILGSNKTFVGVIEDVFKEYGISINSSLYNDILSENAAFIKADEVERAERKHIYEKIEDIFEPISATLEEAGDIVEGTQDAFEKIDEGIQTVGGILTIASWFKSLLSPHADGITSTPSDQTALINEVGTEAIITPEGTITSLPSKTGIIPADITKNLWALGEVAPNLVARLGSLSVPKTNSNIENTTYEEGQYIDNLTMNVYPTKDYDMDRLLAEARSKVKLTKHNN